MAGGNNLIVGIGADSSKLRADLAIAQAQLADFGKELRDASKDAVQTGDRGAVDVLAQKYERARGAVIGIKEELKTLKSESGESPEGGGQSGILGWARNLGTSMGFLGPAVHEVGKAHEELHTPLSHAREAVGEVHRAFGELGTALGEMIERTLPRLREALGLSLGVGIYELLRTVKEAAAGVRETENTARAFGFDPAQWEGVELALAKTGVNADGARLMMMRFSTAVGQARQEAEKLGGGATAGAGGVTILRGSVGAAVGSVETLRGGVKNLAADMESGVKVLHGAAKDIPDFSAPAKSLQTMGVELSKFTRDGAGQIRLMSEFAEKFDKLKPDQQALVGRQFFGRNWVESIKGLQDFRKSYAEAIKEIEESGLGLEKNESNQAKSFNTTLALMEFYIERAKSIIGNSLGQAFVPVMQEIVKQLGANSGAIRHWAEETGEYFKQVAKDFINIFKGGEAETGIGKDFIAIRTAVVAAAGAIKLAFEGVTPILDGIATAINSIFGTHLTATSIMVIAAVGAMSGAFTVLSAAIGVGAALLSPGGLILVGIIAVGVAIYKLPTILSAVGNAFRAFGDAIDYGLKWLVGDTLGGIISAFVTGPIKLISGGFQVIADVIRVIGDLLRGDFAKAMTDLGKVGEDFKAIWTGIENVVLGVLTRIGDALNGLLEIAKSVGSAIASAFGAAGGGPAAGAASTTSTVGDVSAAGLHAVGGYIRGPGSGTSDSIPARLSNGEYVVRAAAVSRIGTRALDHLNSVGYAMGGLVGQALGFSPSIPSFAGGGFVGAGGGQVHQLDLSFNGGTPHRVSTDAGTLNSLMRSARHEQMTSAGRMPGWRGS